MLVGTRKRLRLGGNDKDGDELFVLSTDYNATAAVRLTYINTKYNNQNDNYSFCWIVAPEGILQNIKMHEDKEKIYVVRADEKEQDVFEWLGEYYKTQVSDGNSIEKRNVNE